LTLFFNGVIGVIILLLLLFILFYSLIRFLTLDLELISEGEISVSVLDKTVTNLDVFEFEEVLV